MKHKDSKQWNRKPFDILGSKSSKNFEAYMRIAKAKQYIGKYILVRNPWGLSKEMIYLGLLKDARIFENQSFLVLVQDNGQKNTIELCEITIHACGHRDLIESVSLDDIIAIDEKDSARLYYELLD